MRKFFYFLLGLLLVCTVVIADDRDLEREALEAALLQAENALPLQDLQGKTIAVLPFLQDKSGILDGRMKNMLTSAGLLCVEGKEDPMWNEIIKEIAWNERKDDILDPATLQKFGRLKAAQVLLYGMVTAIDNTKERIYVEIDLHATEIETRRHIWGGTFARRIYKSPAVHGIVDITPELREILKNLFEDGKKSLKDSTTAAKLGKTRTVAVLPLAGDIDAYITGLATAMLTETLYTPKNYRISSVQQLRGLAREGRFDADAFMYGAVRDLSEQVSEVILDSEKSQKIIRYILSAEIQLFIEDPRSGDVLWSRTLSVMEPRQGSTTLTEEEMTAERERLERERLAKREIEKRKQKEKIDDLPDDIKAEVASNWKSILKWIGIVLGGIILLVLILVIVKGLLRNVFIR
ncbi:MAG: hypothetical protein IJS08_11625 [Victivallales bacterium]|nr:hypothetical protein [Victivallales bacterium]